MEEDTYTTHFDDEGRKEVRKEGRKEGKKEGILVMKASGW
jgi:hypothetical protein